MFSIIKMVTYNFITSNKNKNENENKNKNK